MSVNGPNATQVYFDQTLIVGLANRICELNNNVFLLKLKFIGEFQLFRESNLRQKHPYKRGLSSRDQK